MNKLHDILIITSEALVEIFHFLSSMLQENLVNDWLELLVFIYSYNTWISAYQREDDPRGE